MSSGGGSQPTQTSQTVTQVTIPPELMPYAKRALGEGEKLAYGQPYEQYPGQRMAGLNPLQQQGYMGTMQMAPSSQLSQATGMAGLAGLQAGQLGGSYRPMNAQQFYNPMDVSYSGVGTGPLERFQMNAPQQVGAGQFGGAEAGQYMSPYMQNVVDVQKQQAVQDYSRQMPNLQAAATRAGARGGTRQALVEAEAQRNLQQQLQGIQATGSQQAFQQAQQQYNVDAARALQAAQANQQAGLTTGQQNLQALLGIQQLGSQQGLEAQRLNQAAQLQAQQQALGQRATAAQYGLSGADLAERSRQFGANLGMQGIQQQLAAAGQLGQLGQTQYGQQMGINQAKLTAGQQLSAMEQARLDQAYQDWMAKQRYPYAQIGFMSDLIRGTPTAGGIQTMFQSPASPMSQFGGTALGLAGLYKATQGG